MKMFLCCSLCCSLFLTGPVDAQYESGAVLQVVAKSGLRMRTAPRSNSGTIRILHFGESVVVSQLLSRDTSDQERSGWYDGSWIYVSSDRGSGYVFDAYLSTLEQPTHEDELCYQPFELTAAVRTYLRNHYPVLREEQSPEHNEMISQHTTFHADGISLASADGEGWYKTEVLMPNHRISEAVCLLRSMMVGEDLVKKFEDSLKFYQDRDGHLKKVIAGSDENPITIELTDLGSVKISFIEFEQEDGC